MVPLAAADVVDALEAGGAVLGGRVVDDDVGHRVDEVQQIVDGWPGQPVDPGDQGHVLGGGLCK